MTEARRSHLPDPSEAHHPGLILDRYPAIADDKGHSKADVYRHAVRAMNSTELRTFYKAAWERIKAAMVPGSLLLHFKYDPASKLIVGLGSQNVLEAGLALHRTYGVRGCPALR